MQEIKRKTSTGQHLLRGVWSGEDPPVASLPAGEGSGCRVALCGAAEAGCAAAGRHGREAEKEGTTLPVPGQLSLRRFLSLFTVWFSKAASEGSGSPRRCLRYWWIWGLPYSCLTLLMEEKSCLESWWSSKQPEPIALITAEPCTGREVVDASLCAPS